MFKKIIILTAAVLAVCLCGCTEQTDIPLCSDTAPEVVIKTDDSGNVNGYKLSKPDDKGDGVYYVNISTKKFHKSTCKYSKSSNPENIRIYYNRSKLAADGYSACKVCKP